MKHIFSLLLFLVSTNLFSQEAKIYHLKSPDGKIDFTLSVGDKMEWAVKHQETPIIIPSEISLTLVDGRILGEKPKVKSVVQRQNNTTFKTPIYKKATVKDHYNELQINFENNFGLLIRAFDDGIAYRFFTTFKNQITIKTETANFNFDNDYQSYIPYVRDLRDNDTYIMAFESLYDHIQLSQFAKDTLAFSPILIDLGNGKKAAILEADLEDYPGMFLNINAQTKQGFQSVFAPYPLKENLGGFNKMNYMVTQRAPYIAQKAGTRNFPWRAIIISESDKELVNNDMIQKLAKPTQINDLSWIKPGKVAWDWWNDWNITKVDFKAGINTETYKHYIDFAAANKLEYIIIDEGWSESTDMLKISPKIDLASIIKYGKEKKVGVILWATWYAIDQVLDNAFAKYAEMGVKGFKIDFLDRDDQKMVKSVYKIAKKAADYHLLIDFHGMYKPTGIQRTYPNVINFEGVKGLENSKWTPHDDVPKYDVTIPFIRMLAGPMDYTPGAMRNATQSGFKPSISMPMSQGTRSHQLAMYVIFESPLQMLADSPTAYQKEQESTTFIAKIPTVFEETVALDGKVGEFVALARKNGDTWYAAGMTNWDSREITVDLAFLGNGEFNAEIFRDGINADKDPTDYKIENIKVTAKDQLKLQLANGGGFAIRFETIK